MVEIRSQVAYPILLLSLLAGVAAGGFVGFKLGKGYRGLARYYWIANGVVLAGGLLLSFGVSFLGILSTPLSFFVMGGVAGALFGLRAGYGDDAQKPWQQGEHDDGKGSEHEQHVDNSQEGIDSNEQERDTDG